MEISINKARIKYLRESQRIHQADLADAAGVDQRFISHIETGRKDPSVKVLVRIAKALGATLDELVVVTPESNAV